MLHYKYNSLKITLRVLSFDFRAEELNFNCLRSGHRYIRLVIKTSPQPIKRKASPIVTILTILGIPLVPYSPSLEDRIN